MIAIETASTEPATIPSHRTARPHRKSVSFIVESRSSARAAITFKHHSG